MTRAAALLLASFAIAGSLPAGLTIDKTTDSDGDGESDYDEYLSDSDPFDAGDALRIVGIGVDEMPAEITVDILELLVEAAYAGGRRKAELLGQANRRIEASRFGMEAGLIGNRLGSSLGHG